jgi:hypothetical protein
MQLVGIFEGQYSNFWCHFKNEVSHINIFFSAYDYLLPARGKLTALTDIQIAVPDGCYGRVGQYSFEQCC